MANLRIGYNNQIDKATLTGTTSPVSTLPVYNLQNIARVEVFRCNSGQVINGNFAGSVLIGMAALWRHTLTGSWSITLYSGANQSGAVHAESGIASDAVWFDEVTAASFRITCSNGTEFDLSRVFIGRYIETEYNPDIGISITFNDDTEQTRTRGGSVAMNTGGQYRVINLDLSYFSAAQRAVLSNLFKTDGRRGDLFVSVDPLDEIGVKTDFEMLCYLKQQPGYTAAYAQWFSTKLQLEEF